MKKYKLTIIYRSLISMILLVTFIMYFISAKTINIFLNKFVYFTIQSNLFVFVMFTILAIKSLINKQTTNINHIVQTSITIYIIITGAVYIIMISNIKDHGTEMDIYQVLSNICNLIFHYIIPILVLIDWILFSDHGSLKWKELLYIMIYPIVYYLFIIIRAQVGNPIEQYISGDLQYSYYPYPFFDIDKNGVIEVIITVLILGACIVALCLLFIYIDRLFKRNKYVIDSK